MDLPEKLKTAIENLTQDTDRAKLANSSRDISERYRSNTGTGEKMLKGESEAPAYAAARMPATYGAIFSSLKYALDAMESAITSPVTLLDVGAGTGAVSWAAEDLLSPVKITCVENEEAMLSTGKRLMTENPDLSVKTDWIKIDAATSALPCSADIVIASYFLNEIAVGGQARVLQKLWDATRTLLLIVEPGTPAGYRQMMEHRRILIESGAEIIAPCPHGRECPLKADDWCAFKCRIPRSRLHRQLKDGDAPYEDEKFIYLAALRPGKPLQHSAAVVPNHSAAQPPDTVAATPDEADYHAMYGNSPVARIIRHPRVDKGRITLELCSAEGLKKVTITKKDGELYKAARKAETGDTIELP